MVCVVRTYGEGDVKNSVDWLSISLVRCKCLAGIVVVCDTLRPCRYPYNPSLSVLSVA